MELPIQIVFRQMKRSAWLEGLIRERAKKLESFFDRIIACRVVVEIPHRHHHQGNFYAVRIDISVPGKEIVISREPSKHAAYEDINAVLKDVFDAAKRQLEDYVRVKRGYVKAHASSAQARVTRLFPDDRYGFVETYDGRELYFHANSLVNGKFDQLAVGAEVAFSEEEGEKGPQASSVRVISQAVRF